MPVSSATLCSVRPASRRKWRIFGPMDDVVTPSIGATEASPAIDVSASSLRTSRMAAGLRPFSVRSQPIVFSRSISA